MVRETAERYAEIRHELKAAGTPIPTNDLWIAALARHHRMRLVTRDSHFRAIQGLRIRGSGSSNGPPPHQHCRMYNKTILIRLSPTN